MATVLFEQTRLRGTGKAGIVTPDSDGYYEMPLGALNAVNSMGQYYTAEGSRKLFESSSSFMRRVANGCLKIEVEHPSLKPGMTEDDYIDRLLKIELPNVCGHISSVWLDDDFGKKNPFFKNPDMVGILGKVRPSGEKATMLKDALENPKENVCFSIRSFTKNFFNRGRTYKVLDTIVTFDLVNEGGIESASKWSSPSIETLSDRQMTERIMKRIIERTPEVSMEDSRCIAVEVLKTIRAEKKKPSPLYASW